MGHASGPSAREYLAAIYEMAEEDIPPVQAELARWVGVSPPSVSEAVKRLRRDGLLKEAGRELVFTKVGAREARKLVRRHRLAERFLIEVIGLPWHQAHEEASAWEKVISDQVEGRLTAILDDPATCPHGNPIPGSAHRVDLSDLRPLRSFGSGDRVVLQRLTEDLELELEVMRYFEENGLMPGASIEVRDVAPDGTMTLEAGGRSVGLGAELTDNLWVRPLG
jgi:DtxR family transcriptional regulator, Mn-dependent transcriptional regulator